MTQEIKDTVYITVWQKVGDLWVIERSDTAGYAKTYLGDSLEKEINGRFYKAFPEHINPNGKYT